jgi:hypothetical protein
LSGGRLRPGKTRRALFKQISETGRGIAFMRPKVRRPDALKNHVLAASLTFGARHFLVLFDNVPFSIADHADHIGLPAIQLPPHRQGFE